MRKQPFIETFTGGRFQPLSPVSSDINICDIAHALSNQCRFSGHTKEHYSVAQHSVLVSELLETLNYSVADQLWGLLHDASEAYLVDLPTPLKDHPALGTFYRKAERRLMRSICRRFGLPAKEPLGVKWADGTVLATEARDLMAYRSNHWKKLVLHPLDYRIKAWSQHAAERAFVDKFYELGGTHR